MERIQFNLKRMGLLSMIVMLVLVACDPTEDGTPTGSPKPPTAIAKNPPNVWIDQPLPGQPLVLSELPEQIVAHAAGLTGGAQLEIRNGADEVLAVVDLGGPEDTIDTGALISRYTSDWLPALDELLAEMQGVLVLKLIVSVNGVDSAPVIFTILRETDTPTPTLTPTATITTSATATATFTDTPSPTDTNTPTNSPTLTETATWTPTITTTPTATLIDTITPVDTVTPEPTFTPINTPTEAVLAPVEPEIPWFPKDPIACELTATGSERVQGRVGPGNHRGVKLFISAPQNYEVIAYNDDFGMWWLFQYSNRETAWADDRLVDTTGSCLLLPYEEAPDVIRQIPTTAPTTESSPGEPVIYYFYADDTNLPQYLGGTLEFCTLLHWDVEFVDGVFLNGEGVPGENVSREVCVVDDDLEFTLEIFKDGEVADSRTVIITYGTSTPPLEECYYVSRSVSPSGFGSIIMGGSNCGEGGYTPGTVVSVLASPNEGRYFINWTGSCPIQDPTDTSTIFIMVDDCSVIGNFGNIIE